MNRRYKGTYFFLVMVMKRNGVIYWEPNRDSEDRRDARNDRDRGGSGRNRNSGGSGRRGLFERLKGVGIERVRSRVLRIYFNIFFCSVPALIV